MPTVNLKHHTGILPGDVNQTWSVITDQQSLRGASAWFGVLELREPHLQNLPHRHPAVAVFFDEDELLRIGQTGRNHHFSTSFQLVDQRRGDEGSARSPDKPLRKGETRAALGAPATL